jgi:hypothetical protein
MLRGCSLATAHQIQWHVWNELHRITDTASMEESNDTNLKPVLPIHFFNKRMKIGMVLVPRQDGWRKRLHGTSTMHGTGTMLRLKVLTLWRPSVHYSGRTAPLTSRRCILNIYSTNARTEYFKRCCIISVFLSSKCHLFHNATLFGSCYSHFKYRVC